MKKPKRFLIVLLSILCLFALLAFTACGNVEQNGNAEQNGNTEQGGDIEDNKQPQSQGGNENNEPPQSQKQDYDMSGVIFGDLIVEYDGYEHFIIATNLPEGVTATYENNGKINAGTYTVTAHFAGDSENYNPIPDKTATLTINKATYDMSGVVFKDLTVTYDGQPHSLVATNLPQGVTVTYENNGKIEVGTYTVTAKFTGDSINYEPLTKRTAILTILPQALAEISFESKSFVYDGQPKSLTITGSLPDGVTVTYIGNGQINAGIYTVTAKFNTPSNYESLPDLIATLTITKATYDMNGVVFEDLTVIYDGQPHSLVATNVPQGLGVTYENNNKTEIGTYTVTAKFTGDIVNYQPIPNKTAKLTIIEPPITGLVSADGFDIDYSKEVPLVYCTVSNSTTYIDLSNKITVTANCTWNLYQDFAGLTELVLKSINLETGHNTAYLIVYASNGDFVRYEVDIYRLDIKSYTFKNVNSVYESGTVEEKSSITAPQNPERTGYTFTGWAVEGSSDLVRFPYTVTEDITFVAQYELINYTITYHLNGGENDANNPESYNIETPTIILKPAILTNCVFESWYIDENFVTPIPEIALGSYGDKDLYAKWVNATEGLIYTLSGNEYQVIGYNGTDTDILIPDEWKGLPVTSIGQYAFSTCTSLISIIIPASIKSIGNHAFIGCTRLTTVYWNATSCTTAGSNLYPIFSGCTAFTTVVIGEGVQKIPFNAFYDCTSLNAVCITNLASWCNIFFSDDTVNPLYYAHNLYLNNELVKELEIPENITSIGNYAFYHCTSLTSVAIPSSVTSIGSYAFWECTNLSSVYITDMASWCNISFGYDYTGNPLYSAHNLYLNSELVEELKIPKGVTYIKSSAFCGYNGSSITIPNSVAFIDRYAFKGCTAEIIWETNPHIASIGNHAFDDYRGTSITIPSSVTSIGSYAFFDCKSLTSITIPNGVTRVEEFAFAACSSLISINIPESVFIIQRCAFQYCTSLTSISIPSKVTSIENSVFQYCISLTSISIPSGVTNIGNYAFNGCEKLSSVYYGGTAEKWNEIYIGSYNNINLINATRYYYSDEYPYTDEVTEGNFWHYDDVTDEIVIWTKQQ